MLYSYSQDAKPFTMNSAGGTATIAGDIYEWSFAEMMLVNTSSGSNLVVTSGILQPFAPYVDINDPVASEIPMFVYPNPTAGLLNLVTGFKEQGKLLYQLFDVSGKNLISQRISLSSGDNITTLSLDQFPAGEYLLNVVFKADNSIMHNRSFTIQKIK